MIGVRRGCLVIADIGGYTTYLSGVELEHSTDVLGDLLQTVVDALGATLTLAKIEGDAVFCYDGGEADGAVLVDAVTGAYLAFMRRQRTIATLTSCSCEACRCIPDLRLKFAAHRGEYAFQEIAGRSELVGSDVILVHRLLKNTIAAQTGVTDYAAYTRALVDDLGLVPELLGWTPATERYEDVGEVHVFVDDLTRRWDRETATPRHAVAPGEGSQLTWTFTAPPPLVWEHLAHPERQVRFMADSSTQVAPAGARAPGMSTHCVHGAQSYDLEVLDWIPYEFQALRFRSHGLEFLYTCSYEALPGGGTRLTAHLAPLGGRAARALFPLTRRRIRREYEQWMRSLEQLLADEAASAPA